jgi:Leucine-rich repeat (LRR) protein
MRLRVPAFARLPRFSLRWLFVLIALVAIPLAWLANIWNRVQRQREVVARIEASGGRVFYNYQFGMGEEIGAPPDYSASKTSYETTDDGRNKRTRVSAAGTIVEIEQPPGPRPIRWLLGDDAFARVVAFEVWDFDIETFDPQLFRELPELKSITLIGPRLTDDHATSAANVPQLRALCLAGNEQTTISRQAIESLAASPELRSLQLSNEWLTDDVAAGVGKLTQLHTLTIHSPHLTSTVFDHIRPLSNLQELSFFRAKGIDDRGTHHLRELKNLRGLSLHGTSVSSDTGVHLAELTKLESLNLSYTEFGDAGLRQLKDLKNLQVLGLGRTRITDESLTVLSRFPKLRYLNLGGTKITDEGLQTIGGLTQLETLDLFPNEVSDAGLIHLRSLQNLKELSIGPNITVAAANDLRAALPNCNVHRVNKEGRSSWPDYD